MNMNELYQAVIVDHGQRPRNFYANEKATHIKEGYNPLCGDKLTLYLVEKGGVVEEASFQGEGCAISMASASLMTESLKGKTRQEIDVLFDEFHALVTRDKTAEACATAAEQLGKLQALGGVAEYPMRVKCATLAWHALLAALKNTADKVSTENETTLITLTDKAAAHIKKMLSDKPAALGFRLSLKTSGCSGYMYKPELITERVDSDIHFFVQQGVPVFVDAAYASILKNTVIDFADKGMGQKQIMFNNPNAANACGCGESFNVKADN